MPTRHPSPTTKPSDNDAVAVTEVPSRPGQPQVASQTDTSVTLSWDGPAWDGGSPVLQYVVERREMRGARWVRVHKSAVAGPPHTVTDLLAASCYQFRVHAVNAVGLSEPSPMSKVIACVTTGQNAIYDTIDVTDVEK